MEKFEEKIGYKFKNIDLLKTAFTHSSYANERKNVECYERLEFLGDSILGFVTAEFLYSNCQELAEGKMTRVRSKLVCEEALFNIAEKLEISEYVLVGKGEEKCGGKKKISIQADIVEAIIAAIYLDSGLDEAKKFIFANVLNDVDPDEISSSSDFKSALQELAQVDGAADIRYFEISESGPDHLKVFSFGVSVNGKELGRGEGRTKKEAEQAAARKALETLK